MAHATPALSFLSVDDPTFSQPVDLAWQPPRDWDSLDLDPDRRTWIQGMADLGLRSKATGACTCGAFFRRILEYSDHWTRAGRTTCHIFTCRNCGRGKMRAHRAAMSNPSAYAWATLQDSRTIRLTIEHDAASGSRAEYRARVQGDKKYLSLFKRRLRREFGPDAGLSISVELDPAMRDTFFRLYYVGPSSLHHSWIARQWEAITGLGKFLRVAATSRSWSREQSSDALRWMLDSHIPILMLHGRERAQWEEAFGGFRFSASSGSLRGISSDDADVTTEPGADPAAPYGYCPCGCGGVIQRSRPSDPQSSTEISLMYKQVDFGGALRNYHANRHKVVTQVDHAAFGRSVEWSQDRAGPS